MRQTTTVSADEALGGSWDAIVVGAGPAGAIAAHQLAGGGRTVLMIDKRSFPRPKVCGGCLNRRSVAALESCGLHTLLPDIDAQPVRGLRLLAQRRRVDVPLQGGVSVSRRAFDAALLDAAVAAGARFLDRTRVVGTRLTADSRVVACRGDAGPFELQASVVVDAHGLGGAPLYQRDPSADGTAPEDSRHDTSGRPAVTTSATSRIGAGAVVDGRGLLADGQIHMACGRHGYLGAVTVEDGQVDMAAALDPGPVRDLGLAGAVMTIAEEAGVLELATLADCEWSGTPLLTRSPGDIAAARVFAVGDAAGYVEPFTGEGVAWALHGGIAAATLANQAVEAWDDSLCEQWRREHRRLVGRRQWLIRRLASMLRKRWSTALLIGSLRTCPWVATPFTRWLDSVPRQSSPRAVLDVGKAAQ